MKHLNMAQAKTNTTHYEVHHHVLKYIFVEKIKWPCLHCSHGIPDLLMPNAFLLKDPLKINLLL